MKNIDYFMLQGYSREESKLLVQKENAVKGNKKRVENLRKELEKYIEEAKKEGYSGDYAEKIARERRKKEKKRKSPMTIEFWVEKGYSKEEAEYKIKSQRKLNKEYWIERGYTEKESIEKVKEFQNSQQKKVKNYKNNQLNKKYWIERGYNEKESKEKISEIQETFSLEKCIKTHGTEKGKEIWMARQFKWQKTLKEKSPPEIKRINKLKGITLENMIRKWGDTEGKQRYFNWLDKRIEELKKSGFYSKISQELFYTLLSKIDDPENVYFFSHNGEKTLRKNGKTYFYDFYYNNSIIEFNGDYWHMNPSLYESNHYHEVKKKKAYEIWEDDNTKISVAGNKGCKILIVWESDYKNNKELIIDKCIKFLNI
jgi:hypothetical protein